MRLLIHTITPMAALAVLLSIAGSTATALDNSSTDFGTCKPAAGCINSIDATCSKIACAAKECDGNYDSGRCKDLKELHEAGQCGFAKKKCGRDLPRRSLLKNLRPQAPAADRAVK
ncbi:hypothetical protein ABGN05_13995 [Aquibium sp. LZ166]|uniref:Uncharacterized protein n=1 Tax=Aquibium pacificus TaxID=3153579 RepID=A0ABV3SKJ8_9HYPH